MSDLRIDIQGMNDRNVIQEKNFPEFDDLTTLLRPTGGVSASDKVRIVFRSSAVKILFNHISWGKKYHRGDVEQAGIIIGKYYRDISVHDEVIWGDVIAVIPSDSDLVNATFENIDITAQAWGKMYEDAEEYISQGMQVLGWYHTHLDNINTRFSALDRSTQKKSFTFDYSFGVVFNPNQKKWSAFYGPNSTECKGLLLLDNSITEEIEENPQIRIKQVNGDSVLKKDGTVIHLDDNGNPIPLRKQVNHAIEEEDDDQDTLSSVIGQFFTGIGGLLSGKKKKKKNIGHDSHTDANARTESRDQGLPADRISARRREQKPIWESQERLSKERSNNAPKIEILRAPENSSAMIRCAFYSLLSNEEFKLFPNYGLIVKKETIGRLLKLQPVGKNKSPLIYGKMYQQNDCAVLSLSQQEEANCRIIFGKDLTEGEKLKTIALGLYGTSSKAKVRFIVIIDEISSRSVDVRVIHYSKGDII
ncbi:MAG: hypothetical protein HDR04_13435 [Lachnospiraceae bacterium]|nr:hypothetical protein [Lachnospiraceae bacterium]